MQLRRTGSIILAFGFERFNEFDGVLEAIATASKVTEVPLGLIMLLFIEELLVFLVNFDFESEDFIIDGLWGRAIWLSPG